jgi:spore coat protein H
MKIHFGSNRFDWSKVKVWHPLAAILAGALVTSVNVFGAAALPPGSPSAASSQILDSDHLYDSTNVWTIHLKFASDQWEAMEPKSGGNPFGGGPRESVSGNRTLAPVFMSQADLDRDGRLSFEEFSKLAQRWFQVWDTDGSGQLDESQIRAGLDKIRNPSGGGISAMLLAAEGKRNGIAVALGVEFDYVHADLEFEGRWLSNVGVRYKGNGSFMESRNSLKRSLKIDLHKYAKGQSLGNVKMLTLQNNVTDASMMNEVLAYRLYRDAGVPAPRTAYARVFVTVPGKYERKYLGLYSMTEAVDKQFAERHFGTKRGAVFKPVASSLFTDLGADWAAYNQIYDPKVALDAEQQKAVMELSRFVTQAGEAAFAAHIGEYLDLPEFARFMSVMVYLSDLDGILGVGQNLYLHLHPKSQQFQFIPWDQDHSWGQFNRASQDQRDKLSIHHPWQGENPFLERLLKVEAFSKTIFKPDRIAQQVDLTAAIIRPAIQEESESKLARFDKLVAGELLAAPGPFGGGQTKPIKPFTKVRTASVLDQLAGKSEGLVAGGGFPGFGGGGGLGRTFARSLFQILDTNKDARVTQAEFTEGFARLFQTWNSDKSGSLTLAQLRSGIEKTLPPTSQGFSPFGGGPGGPGGFSRGSGGFGGGPPRESNQSQNTQTSEPRPSADKQP